MIRRRFAACIMVLIGLTTAVQAQSSIPQPAFTVGDSWVFDQAHQKGTTGFPQNRADVIVERVGDDSMVVGGKVDGSPANYNDSITGLDWSKRAIVDGRQVVTTRPLKFPLTVGSTWSTDYDVNPKGNQRNGHFSETYKVVGWEDVTLASGTFHALKIEKHGTGEAVLLTPSVAVSATTSTGMGASGMTHVQRATTRTVHVTTYGESYYVPDIKYWVKNVQEQYGEDGTLTSRDTDTLVSFKLAK